VTDWPVLEDDLAFAAVVLEADRPVVVAFEPDACGTCRDQRALLRLLWRQLGWHVRAARVLTDRTPQVPERYRIAVYPTLGLFWRGELVDRLPGPRHPDSVNRRLAALLDVPAAQR
jgi:thioredoxin-like negative regulator of GroEL